ncbi:MAG TPA: fructosamine kinase, partial [Rhizobiales bacterium]|nr:fructosamine kinase [Hyphomicrobiales bacterium]
RLPVPDIIYADPQLLAMSWINSSHSVITPAHERHMARLLSDLHSQPQPCFGFDRDTVIGILPQPNARSKHWIPFFRDQRLLFLARFAHQRGKLPAPLLVRLERLGEKLEKLLDEPAHPALIHGDIWSGNVLLGKNRINALIDPAAYYAHPEIELAFMTMFGSFGEAFFQEYSALTPFDFDTQGFFGLRRDIYLLYPLLVHVLLCGASYLRDIENILQKLKI